MLRPFVLTAVLSLACGDLVLPKLESTYLRVCDRNDNKKFDVSELEFCFDAFQKQCDNYFDATNGEEVFKDADTNSDGIVDKEEFRTKFEQFEVIPPIGKEYFINWDLDNSRNLDMLEMDWLIRQIKNMCVWLGPPLTAEQAVSTADKNGDGGADLKEWLNFMADLLKNNSCPAN